MVPGQKNTKHNQSSENFHLSSFLTKSSGVFLLFSVFSIVIRYFTQVGFATFHLYLTQLACEVMLLKLILDLRQQKNKQTQTLFALLLMLFSACDITLIQSSMVFYCFHNGFAWLGILITCFSISFNLLKVIIIMDQFEISQRIPELIAILTLLVTISLVVPIQSFFPHYPGFGINPWAIYFPIILATGSLLPTIASRWNRQEQSLYKLNKFIKNELNFYLPLILIPALMLPIQLYICSKLLLGSKSLNLASTIHFSIPLLLGLAFFLQAYVRKILDEINYLNFYDFICCIGFFILECVVANGYRESYLEGMNLYIILTAFLVSLIVRKNPLILGFIIGTGLTIVLALSFQAVGRFPGILIVWVLLFTGSILITHKWGRS